MAAATVGLIAGVAVTVGARLLDLGFGIGGSSGDRVVPLAIIAIGIVLDLLHAVTGRLRPPSIGRQVPQEWGRLLAPSVVAVLYGARLGVGPLTLLSTWGWWSATIVSALFGIGPAVVVGGGFGLIRLSVMVAASRSLSRAASGPAVTVLRFRGRERSGRLTLNGLGLVAVLALVVAGCGGPEGEAEAAKGPLHHRPVLISTTTTLITSSAGPPSTPVPTGPTTLVTAPAQLEDFVRPVQLDTRPAPVASALSATPAELSAALVTTIRGFDRIEEETTDRFLDLSAAAGIQPDPTEEVALLETRGFRGGWTRAFRSLANDVAVLSVYQFEDAAEAEFYLEDGLITIGGYGGRFFDIEGLNGVRGFTQSFIEDGEPVMTLGAAFQTGPRWYLVYLVGTPERVGPDVLIPIVLELQASASATIDADG